MFGGPSRARESFLNRAWREACEGFLAERDQLCADDVERLAVCAFLVGRNAESDEAWGLAHRRRLDEGDVLESAVRRLRTAGVSIYSVGIGGPNPIQVPVPADDGEGEAGWTLQVRFQEATLRSIATSGGGRYYRSQTGHELLDAMQDLAKRERRQVGWTTRTEYRDIPVDELRSADAAWLVSSVRLAAGITELDGEPMPYDPDETRELNRYLLSPRE